MDDEDPLLDEFVGVVRGRTPNSFRTAKERGTSGPKKDPAADRRPAPKQSRTGRAPRTTGRPRRGR